MIVDRWQEWLALEHEAVWLFSTIGARHRELEDLGRRAESDHRVMREKLMKRIRDLGSEPVGTLAAYSPATSTAKLSRRSARELEARIAGICLTVVGESDGKERQFGVAGLTQAAVASIAWQGQPAAFPGA